MEVVNQRRLFLSKIRALSLGSLLPFSKMLSTDTKIDRITDTCTLIPAETRGPFPLFAPNEVASQSALIRSDIRETQQGVTLAFSIIVQNLDCLPIAGAKVHIWQCNKDGLYSGYSSSLNPGQAGLTYLRGIQITDEMGYVRFVTIFPGWYAGRLTHIHAEVFVNNVLLHTTQFAFPLESEAGSPTAIVNAFYGRTGNNIVYAYFQDQIFRDGYAEQLLSFAGGVAEGGYTSSHKFILDHNSVARLKIMSFTAGVDNTNAMLWWLTENEINVARFEIEHSLHPSRNFVWMGSVNAIGNSTMPNNYSFTVPQGIPATMNYFRLKIVQTDGSHSYSGVVTFDGQNFDIMSVINSYVTHQLVFRHPAVYHNSMLKVINMSGQLMATGYLKTGASLTSIDVNHLRNGAYLLIIESGIDRHVIKFYKGN